ncbi:MAG: diacylglycerol kinase family lipid kinase [Chloroflexi bacterium]|nr:diacylglycerol kinase family lipid kinase [Chloroflexota bacterium]
MERRIELIFNPAADRGRAGQTAADLRALFEAHGGAHWSPTEHPNHAADIAARAAADGFNVIVALGGDGTVHEVINGLMKIAPAHRPVLGIVPIGSGNDFAGGVGVLRPAPEAARRVLAGEAKSVDVGVIRDEHGRVEYWDNACGIGFDAAVNLQSRTIKGLYGFAMYFAATLKTIALNYDAPHMKLKWDGGEADKPILMLTVGNGPREGGGFQTTPDSKFDDGVLDFVTIDKVSRAMMLRLIPEVMSGKHGRFRQVMISRTTKLTLDADRPIPIHLDGEVFAHYESNVKHVEVEVIPGAIQLMQ